MVSIGSPAANGPSFSGRMNGQQSAMNSGVTCVMNDAACSGVSSVAIRPQIMGPTLAMPIRAASPFGTR